MRTLVYARYSSALQNPRSVEDQLADCRARTEREGWEIVGEYHDSEISGAAGIAETQRPGLAALLARLDQGGVDQVLAEKTDRLARHQGDDFAVRERIEHAGARLYTLMEGEVDDIVGTINGLFNARTRKDIAHRVRRGHRGNIAEGRAASGVAYGYRKLARLDEKGNAVHGLREIDPVTSEIVLEIFEQYAEGRSPRQIARSLNDRNIPAPRGGVWRASTVAGHHREGFGILGNPIYIGELRYGRTRSVTDPKTRKRRMRRGEEAPASGSAGHLRIVSDDLWRKVQGQLEARAAGPAHRQRRPRHLLSGLGECGCCGQKWIITRGEYFGCGGVIEGSSCPNRRLITKADYEERVIASLKAEMLAPDVVAAYLDERRREYDRHAREAARERRQLERRKADAERKVANLVAALSDGGSEFAEIRAALASAKADAETSTRALASLAALPDLLIHPALAQQYERAIENLAEELADDATRQEAAPRLRALISRIVVRPADAKRGVTLTVIRHIDEVLTLARRTA